jgi:spermidine synthase
LRRHPRPGRTAAKRAACAPRAAHTISWLDLAGATALKAPSNRPPRPASGAAEKMMHATRRHLMLGVGLWALGACGARAEESGLIEKRESQYNTIYIRREGPYIGMIFGVNTKLFTESLYNPADPKELPVVYTRYMTAALAYPATLTSALEIGLGGGRTASYLNKHMPALSLTCVELDPQVIALAKKYFGVAETATMKIVAKDGRSFLRTDPQKHDLIMIDAYRGTFVPFHLLTKEFFETVKAHLKPGGVCAQNIEPTTMLFPAAIATLKAVFQHVDTYYADGNVVAIAYDGPVKTNENLLARANDLQARYKFRHPLPQLLSARQSDVSPPASAKALTDDFAPVDSLRATKRYNKKRWF